MKRAIGGFALAAAIGWACALAPSLPLSAETAGESKAASSPAAESTSSAPGAAKPPAIGARVPDITFKDIRFAPHTLADFGDKQAFVIVFTTVDCPVVKRYLPRVVELERAYRDRGVQFMALDVGPNDPLVEVAYQGLQVDATFPFCKDFDGVVAPALGVTRTPQVVVLDRDRTLKYRGRIDSQFRVAGVKPTTGREDLKEAIEDVLAGREVSVAETPVDGCPITSNVVPAPEKQVTYAEQIAPLMRTHCEECHRPNAEGPFPLTTYQDVVDHSETVAEVVREQRMPPEYASRQHGDFVNLHGMSPEERTLVAQWVAGGRAPGDLSKVLPKKEWPSDRWLIGEPDLVLKMPVPVELPATGYIPYKYVLLPHTFKEDTWVTACQILPENRSALHHCNLAYVNPLDLHFDKGHFITGQVPGGIPMVLDEGVGYKIPRGSVLVMQIHYVTTGAVATDQSSVGFRFAKGPIDKQLKHFECHNGKFAIPPGDPACRVESRRTFKADATLIGMFSHMHLRGKDMTFDALYPDGTQERLLAIPNYSFDWQMSYVWRHGAKKFPRGTSIDVVAHFDNSAFNPFNPDPTATVREGNQTFEEMMYGFVFYVEDDEHLNMVVDPHTGYEIKPAKKRAAESEDATAQAGG